MTPTCKFAAQITIGMLGVLTPFILAVAVALVSMGQTNAQTLIRIATLEESVKENRQQMRSDIDRLGDKLDTVISTLLRTPR